MRHDAHFVEDLTVGDNEPIGKMLPVSMIEPDPVQPRSNMGDMGQLADSIRDKGVLEPILVRSVGAEGERNEASRPYRIVSGERRYQAALQIGLYEIPVIEMEIDEKEALEIALVENLQRKDLTPFEEGEGYSRLAEEHGYTHEQIAAAVGKSRSVVTESLSLLQMPSRARDAAVALGIASKSLLLEVLKSGGDESDMIELLEQIVERGLSRDDLRKTERFAGGRRRATRRKPYTFRFRAPDKTFNLALTFRKSTVDREDLISALQEILTQLKEEKEEP
jgi:ParB family chromosome partitioning protein